MTDEKHSADGTTLMTAASAPNALARPSRKSLAERAADDVVDLFLRKPLYATIQGDDAYLEAVEDVLNGDAAVDFDNYCPACEQVTPWSLRKYRVRNSGGGAPSGRYVQASLPDIRAVNAVCVRRQHFHTYIVHVKGGKLQKVGQRPSVADLALGELNTIKGIEKQDRRELGRALGLFAHDTPLGAFVYLRRVFERMIDRAHKRHTTNHGTPLENWRDLRMGDRIAALADELPAVVRSNSAVWRLLSKGIHELSDEDAQTLFPLVKAVIFEMLGEEERHRQAATQSEATRKALAAAAERFKG